MENVPKKEVMDDSVSCTGSSVSSLILSSMAERSSALGRSMVTNAFSMCGRTTGSLQVRYCSTICRRYTILFSVNALTPVVEGAPPFPEAEPAPPPR